MHPVSLQAVVRGIATTLHAPHSITVPLSIHSHTLRSVQPTHSTLIRRCRSSSSKLPAQDFISARFFKGVRDENLATLVQGPSGGQQRQILASRLASAGTQHQRCISRESRLEQLPQRAASEVEPQRERLMMTRKIELQDCQVHMTMHGGIAMQMMERAGSDFSAQYCQSFQTKYSGHVTTMTSCVERAEYASPMFVDEVCEIYAKLGYTSAHSLQVILKMYARPEDEDGDAKRLAIRATIWYVPVLRSSKGSSRGSSIIPVPAPMPPLNDEAKLAGLASYEALKRFRTEQAAERRVVAAAPSIALARRDRGDESYTVALTSMQMLRRVVRSDCWPGETYCRGDVALKLIDDCGVVAAIHYANYFCATRGVENTIYLKKIELGSLLVATSWIIFTSSKTIEVKVEVDEVRFSSEGASVAPTRVRALESTLTCLAIDDSFQPRDVQPLVMKNDAERQLFAKRKAIYDAKKKERLAKQAADTAV